MNLESRYAPTALHGDYSETLDTRRPRTLLSDTCKGVLQYRYEDTGETTTVPNVWAYQPREEQIKTLVFLAELAERSAACAERLPVCSDSVTNAQLIARHRQRALDYRRQAKELESVQDTSTQLEVHPSRKATG